MDGHKFHSMNNFWKIIWKKAPMYMHRRIQIDENYLLSSEVPRLQTTATSLRFRGIKTWNSLPEDIRKIKSYPRFKIMLKRWILSKRNLPAEPD